MVGIASTDLYSFARHRRTLGRLLAAGTVLVIAASIIGIAYGIALAASGSADRLIGGIGLMFGALFCADLAVLAGIPMAAALLRGQTLSGR